MVVFGINYTQVSLGNTGRQFSSHTDFCGGAMLRNQIYWAILPAISFFLSGQPLSWHRHSYIEGEFIAQTHRLWILSAYTAGVMRDKFVGGQFSQLQRLVEKVLGMTKDVE